MNFNDLSIQQHLQLLHMEADLQSSQPDLRQEEKVLVITREEHKKSQKIEVYEYQVSGKTPKYIDNIHGLIYKKYSQSEHQFYQLLDSIKEGDQGFGIKEFIPQFLGIVDEHQLEGMEELKKETTAGDQTDKTHRNLWIDHIASRSQVETEKHPYLCLRNLTFRFENPNILDLKLGKKKAKKSNQKFKTSTTNSHGFRINGMVVQLHNGQEFQECFVSKYFGQKITVDFIENYLALFFFDGFKINEKLLNTALEQLGNLIQKFKLFEGVKFISSSLFLAYDASQPSELCLKLIDFDKYQKDEGVKTDDNVLAGLESILFYLGKIAKSPKEHQELLLKKQLAIFGEDVVIVPEHKMAEYKFKKAEEEENL